MGRRAEFEERRDLTRLLVGRVGRRHQNVRAATAVLLGDDVRLSRQASEVRRVLDGESPTRLLDFWEAERIGALAIERARQWLELSNPAWDAAALELRSSSDRTAGLSDLIMIQATSRLRLEGIPSVLLKGRTLAKRLYGEPSLRSPSKDVDLLVPSARLFDAHRACREMGWPAAKDPLYADGLPALHLCLPSVGPLPVLEIHWRVQMYSATHSDGLIERAELFEGLPVLAPADLLDVVLQAWARDGFRRLRLGADIAAWWRRFGREVPSADLRRIFEAPGTGRPARIASEAAARLFGTPMPELQMLDRRARFAIAIACTDAPVRRNPRPHTQPAVVDLLVCESALLGQRANHKLLMAPELIKSNHPWAPAWFVKPMRAISAARTICGALPIFIRASIFGRRER